MLKKTLSIIFIILLFILTFIFFIPRNKTYKVIDIVTPCEIMINNIDFKMDDIICFDSTFSVQNKTLAKKLNILEEEAFILGNLGKYWAQNILKNRKVTIKDNNLIYNNNSYKDKLLYSGFALKNDKPINEYSFNYYVEDIRRGYYRVLDLETDKIYKITDNEVRSLNKFLVLKTYSLPFKLLLKKKSTINKPVQKFKKGRIKAFFTDHTDKLTLDDKCNTDVCQEILLNIRQARKTIDIALYGYSRVTEIEKALIEAKNRGVNIRLLYDADRFGENIYPHTKDLANLLGNAVSDKNSVEAGYKMHNKFYIFDDKNLILGSANLSQTDMSGFNSNVIVSIEDPKIANFYKQEFEQMYGGKFHNSKVQSNQNSFMIDGIKVAVFFSPQDKGIENAILPIVKDAKRYIYIPTFVLTEKRLAEALAYAKAHGVEVKIIMDALSSSTKHSKIDELRKAGVDVKTENYAGKMHSKSMIVDDKYTIIGSMNFSNSGENKNDENFIVIEDKDIAMAYKNFFEYQWEKIDNKWLNYKVRAEGDDSIGSCSDGLDNNYDGLVDKMDPACR